MAASPTAADPRALAALLLNPYVVGGVMAWGVATLLWVVVLSRAPLTHVYALGSLNYVAVPLLSSALLGEPLGRAQLPGMALVAAGVALTLAGRAAP